MNKPALSLDSASAQPTKLPIAEHVAAASALWTNTQLNAAMGATLFKVPWCSALTSSNDRARRDASCAALKRLRRMISEQGYLPVPVLSVDEASVSASGKKLSPGKGTYITKWQTIYATRDDDRAGNELPKGQASTGVLAGVGTVPLAAIDIDILDSALADQVKTQAFKTFGPTPLIRIGRAPKLLLLYRTEVDLSKMQFAPLFLPDAAGAYDISGEYHKVEILGKGQQFVVAGVHPTTGQPYLWSEQTPLDVAAEDLPLVNEAQLQEFKTFAETILRAVGGKTKAEISSKPKHTGNDLKPVSSQASGAKCGELDESDLARDALKTINSDDYDTWILVLAALEGSRLRDARAIANEWSRESSRYDAAEFDAKWTSLKGANASGARASLGTIFMLAERAGWVNPNKEKKKSATGKFNERARERESAEIKAAGEKDATTRGLLVKSPDWRRRLQCAENGAPRATNFNCALAIINLTDMPEFALNVFSCRHMVMTRPYWDDRWAGPRDIEDADFRVIHLHLENEEIYCSPHAVIASVLTVAEQNAVNPPLKKLTSLQWDGVPRIADWLSTYAGVEKTLYTQAVGKAYIISAAARIMQPGCKVDHMLVLEGEQGKKKSTLAEKLCTALDPDGFVEVAGDLTERDTKLKLRGRIIVEMAELASIGNSALASLKAEITTKVDTYRDPYARTSKAHLRTFVFFGTVNPAGAGYLKDPTGGRRFWPVTVGDIDIEFFEKDVLQLWAEARVAVEKGEKWWLDKDIELLATDEQSERLEVDSTTDAVAAAIGHMSDTVRTLGFTLNDVFEEMKLGVEKRGRGLETKIGVALKTLGYTSSKRTGSDGNRTRVYTKNGARAGNVSQLKTARI